MYITGHFLFPFDSTLTGSSAKPSQGTPQPLTLPGKTSPHPTALPQPFMYQFSWKHLPRSHWSCQTLFPEDKSLPHTFFKPVTDDTSVLQVCLNRLKGEWEKHQN